MKKLIMYTDGCSRGNPGPSGIGVVIMDSRKKIIKEISKYIGETTNNLAEYSAIICGLEEARVLGTEDITVCVDSELVAKQLNGEYRVKDPGIKALFVKALDILKDFKSFEIKHVDRSKNKNADRLANRSVNLSSLF